MFSPALMWNFNCGPAFPKAVSATMVAMRQIRYWEEKGIIKSLTEEEGKNRRYDYRNIKKILLVKELLDEGYTLDASAQKVQKRLDMIENVLGKLKE